MTVTTLLVLAVLAGRFTGYLADAAAGRISGSAATLILALRLPEFVALLMPLGLFVGMALTLLRQVADSELVALRAAGLSSRWLIGWASAVALPVALLIALCACWLAPASARNLPNILLGHEGLNEFSVVRAGRFVVGPAGRMTVWAAGVSADAGTLVDVFVAEQDSPHTSIVGQMRITLADTATQYVDPATGSRFLLLTNGVRYAGEPGTLPFRIMAFETLGERVVRNAVDVRTDRAAGLTMTALLASRLPEHAAEWQWRLVQVLLAPLAALLVIALLPVTARAGRSAPLFGGVAVYVVTFMLLSLARDAVADGTLPAAVGVWPLLAAAYAAVLGVIVRRELYRGIPAR